ncbi:hypothetical protein EPR50_G00093300 [Perca flavescens]|uniref:Uncharacterized protein n=1 Tax=Perca flavescens TaxID=8167 RepID=A0A484D3T3_PERFV|nr:hypothetical protein EPR50_G00093300 [Perca flavescens]
MLECDPDWDPSLYLGHTEVKATNTDRFKWFNNGNPRRLALTTLVLRLSWIMQHLYTQTTLHLQLRWEVP